MLLAVNPNYYTLQLVAMVSESSLKEFIKEHQLADKDIYVYHTIRNEKNWYMVIYGQFESRKIALVEAGKLAKSSSKLASWVKKYASVHQDLQLNE
jgi:DamX protein